MDWTPQTILFALGARMDARGVVDDDREFWEHLCSMYALHESRIDEGFYWLQQNGYVGLR